MDEFDHFNDAPESPSGFDPYASFADVGSPQAVASPQPMTGGQQLQQPTTALRQPASFSERALRGAAEIGIVPGRVAAATVSGIGNFIGNENMGRFIDRYEGAQQGFRADSDAMAPEGFDAGRFTGQMVASLPLGGLRLAGGAGRAAGLINSAAQGGASSALMSPDNTGQGAAIGTGIGLVLPPALQRVGVGLKAATQPLIKGASELKAAGIQLTPGMALGRGAKQLEDKLTSVPLLGNAVAGSQRRTVEEFNTAIINKALTPIGEKLPPGIKGREAIAFLQDATSNAYGKTLNRIGAVDMDGQFLQDVASLQSNAAQMFNTTPALRDKLQGILQSEVLNKFPPNGRMDASLYKQIDSRLGQFQSELSGAPDVYSNDAGKIVSSLRDSLKDVLRRAAPQERAALDAADLSFAMRSRIDDAASRIGAAEGIFTPEQLFSAVKKGDRSKGGRGFARGDALMQDFSEQAKSIIGSKYPDSGTAGRGMVGALATGALGATSLVPTAVGLGAASLPYLPIFRAAAGNAAASVPKGISSLGGLSELLSRSPAALAAAGTPTLQNLLASSPKARP